MGPLLRHGSLVLFFIALVMPFNNCAPTNSAVTNSDGSYGSTPITTSLSITVSGSGQVPVPVNTQNFNLSGTCSIGPYATSVIDWEMVVNNADVWDAYMAGGGQYLTTCTNGQFTAVIKVPCPGAINNSQGCFGLTQNYTLVIRIVGETSTGVEAAVVDANAVTLQPAP
jgi:hypothetical protein